MSDAHLRQSMNEVIKFANLPDKKVKTVLIGQHSDIIEKLNLIGFETLVLDDNPDIDPSVKNHADMAAIHLGTSEFILDKRQQRIGEKLISLGFNVEFTNDEISGKYPFDARLNSVILKDKLICGKKEVDEKILSLPLMKIKVNQGYCRCSVCILNENAIITDDISIYKATKDVFDVLLIEKGDIYLQGKDYGFIGGASAKIDSDKVLFFGSLKYHRDGEKIKEFIKSHNLKYLELFDGRLRDIGSMIAVK